MENKFTITGSVGDAFIKISKDRNVQLIFGEDEDSIYREVDWESHEVYKDATNFALMLDAYLRNSKALDDLITTSATGSIPAELIGRDLLPIILSGAGLEEFQLQEEEPEEPKEQPKKYKDNIIQFNKKEKDDENK